ncbi:hypothetical protein H5410_013949 [Solanum commersonii]|uniref:F-box associated beta-propeller type 3 domain-containing protein n=1 Tax=Solanum commersonii TaxID=4109 RepID=A0A9J5ZPJ9_SOLCO|nr:hypothetical protein H5410_013949 [Solanum commersonii]
MATTPLSSNREKKMKSTKIKSISLDIIFEIFSLFLVKSLILSESNFVDLHHCRSMTRPNGRKYHVHQSKEFYTLELKEDEIGSFIRIDENLHIFCEHDHTYYHPICVNGLFCVWKDTQHVVICNASTREVRFLPSLDENIHIYQNYNFYFYSIGYTRNWISTLDTNESWRETQSVDCFMSRKRVCFNGVIYILSYEYLSFKLKIVAFDVGVETFTILTCPYGSLIIIMTTS